MNFRILILFTFLSTLSFNLIADEESPSWAFEFHGGLFEPALSDWEKYYGSSTLPELGFSFAYKVLPVLDVGLSINYGKDTGTGVLLGDGESTGVVQHQVIPIELFAILRIRVSQGQWLVPYIGGGYTQLFYRQEIEDQSRAQGSVNGTHIRGGLQLLLDALDQGAAQTMFDRWGVQNSYLYVDYKETTISASDTPLDGKSYTMGLLFEY